MQKHDARGNEAGWVTGTCKANGIDIHYLRTGGNKPPVVLLHGLMTNGACWIPLARALEANYDVIMPDARGHGNSNAPEHGYHYDDLAADVIGLIDTLSLPLPLLLGHSMGGISAFRPIKAPLTSEKSRSKRTECPSEEEI